MAGTNNSWNNQIAGSYNQIILNAGTNGVAISTDASAATVSVATGAAVKTTTLGSTNSTSTTTVACGTGGCNVGTSANAHTTTLGSTNSTSATTVQSGSGALNVTSTNGALTINSGTGALGISTDASATTVSFATGGAVKSVTLGSTNSTSATIVQSGSGNVAINTGLTIDSAGRNFNTKQPAFQAVRTATLANATGAGTGVDPIPYDTTVFDQTSSFDGNYFTAPITGRYLFVFEIYLGGLAVANNFGFAQIVVSGTSAQAYQVDIMNPYVNGYDGGGNYSRIYTVIATMTATDIAHTLVRIFGGGADTVDLLGITDTGGVATSFSGYLIC